ncbi:MAG TPA: pyruvate ferredoxin oxidoreductase [Methylomirabilota bacterium]|nr:pyruvate ferredoxin oxidoreductase [Methylomirabilota bacterium]
MLEKVQLTPMSGSEAVAKSVIQSNVDFVSAYPITPQTIIVERISDLVGEGDTKTTFVNVESEHSAISACVGASLAGARSFTATSSQGLALMHEVLYLTSGLRVPLVMAVANRALSAPINIHGDHSDMMGSRDSGWIQYYVENAQEAYDWVMQAFKIAEDDRVMLPFTVNMDGYVITHSVEPVTLIDQATVDKFVPPRVAKTRLDVNSPMTFGTLTLPDYYTEFKRQQEEAMRNVPAVFDEVTSEFAQLIGRGYKQLVPFELDGAKVIVVSLGSASGTIRYVARGLRSKGLPVGALRIGLFRPFPSEQFAKLVANADVVVVLERAMSLGSKCGPLASEVVNSLYDRPSQPRILDVIAGLGGRDLAPEAIEKLFKTGLEAASNRSGLEMEFLGVRE